MCFEVEVEVYLFINTWQLKTELRIYLHNKSSLFIKAKSTLKHCFTVMVKPTVHTIPSKKKILIFENALQTCGI